MNDPLDLSKDAAIDAALARESEQAKAIEAQMEACRLIGTHCRSLYEHVIEPSTLAALFSTANLCRRLEKQVRDLEVLNASLRERISETKENP